MPEETTRPRKPWIALVLSLVLTGLGHVYCGRIVKGLVLLTAYTLFLPGVILAARLPPSTAILAGILSLALVALGAILYALVDAFRLARRLDDYRLKDYNRAVVYGIFVVLGLAYPTMASEYVKENALRAYYIPASGMAPAILKGDFVMANRVVYRSSEPARGDVVVLRDPDNRKRQLVKRVVGLPGDTVEIRGDRRVVPAGRCYVLGDNRDHSRDSRHFGLVPLGDLLGPVQYIYLPAESWSRFGALPR